MSYKNKTESFPLTEDEQKMIVRSLYDIRNRLREIGDPAEDVEELILRVIHAPEHRKVRLTDRGAR